jgi:hypothetical protein
MLPVRYQRPLSLRPEFIDFALEPLDRILVMLDAGDFEPL